MFQTVNDGKLPTRGSKYSAYVDVYANEDVVIGAGETKLIALGIAICEDGLNKVNTLHVKIEEELYPHLSISNNVDFFKKSHYLELAIRSSLAVKGLMLGNGIGVVDLDYADEIKMIIHNSKRLIGTELSNSGAIYTIKKGDKIGQITLMEHKGYLMGISSDKERVGGFGSTGK